MELNWFEGILYGLISGLTDILPVSSQAHRQLLLKLFGGSMEPAMLSLMLDIGILAALYISCQTHIVKIIRAKRLSRVPKRRRKRPLDTRSLMDLSLIQTMLIPVILIFLCYGRIQPLYEKVRSAGFGMVWIAVGLMINGVVLYAPQFFAGGNRDSRTLSRVQGLLMGLGGAASVIPGLSGIGMSNSIGAVCGVDKRYCFQITLLMNMGVHIGFAVWHLVNLINFGNSGTTLIDLLIYIMAGMAAFGGAMGSIKAVRLLISNVGLCAFAYYCWGLSLFSFIMNLLA